MCGCCSAAATWISRVEPVGADAAGQLGCEDLDHDLSPERPLGGEEHARHAAAAELTLDGVRAVQRRFKLLLKIVGQGELRESLS